MPSAPGGCPNGRTLCRPRPLIRCARRLVQSPTRFCIFFFIFLSFFLFLDKIHPFSVACKNKTKIHILNCLHLTNVNTQLGDCHGAHLSCNENFTLRLTFNSHEKKKNTLFTSSNNFFSFNFTVLFGAVAAAAERTFGAAASTGRSFLLHPGSAVELFQR